MQNKVYLADWDHNIPGAPVHVPPRKMCTNTEITGIRYGSFRYNSSVANINGFRLSGTYSSFIEFEYYSSNGITLNKGDMIGYVQLVDVDTSFEPINTSREIVVGFFNVTSIKKTNNVYKITAFDDVSLLDVDFSSILKNHEADFPMYVSDLLTIAADTAGVVMPVILPPGRIIDYATVQYFYSEGITVRDVFNWYTELAATIYKMTQSYVASTAFEDVIAQEGWQQSKKYIICPDDQTYTVDGNTAINVWYKENGMETEGNPISYDGVLIVKSDGSELGHYYDSLPASNVYVIASNILADNIIEFGSTPRPPIRNYTFDDLAQYIFGKINILQSMKFAKIRIFPFRTPFGIGGSVHCVTMDGDQFEVPVLSYELSDSEVVMGAYGFLDDTVSNSEYNLIGNSGTSGILALWAKVNEIVNSIGKFVDFFYPVGSIYISTDPTDPGTLFGGTWEQIKDTFLLTAGDTYTAGDTGGEATHTLTITEMPSHTHDTFYNNNVSASGSNRRNPAGQTGDSTLSPGTSATGGGQAHNNMPPYLVVYAWQRVADAATYLVTIDGDYLTTVDGDYLTL